MTLSILIPTYNTPCLGLVDDLVSQVRQLNLERWEIIVGNDASDDAETLAELRKIECIEGCKVISMPNNSGRSVIRNRLADAAQSEWLLFVDSGTSVVSSSFVERFLQAAKESSGVIYGGYNVIVKEKDKRSSLRAVYERSRANQHKLENRQKEPYKSFRCVSWITEKAVFNTVRFDENLTGYGYEDTFFAAQLQRNGIAIRHIDNPIGYVIDETNEAYLDKTRQAMTTLWTFRQQLKGHNSMLRLVLKLQKLHLLPIVSLILLPFKTIIARQLKGNRPSAFLFQIYKLCLLVEQTNK